MELLDYFTNEQNPLTGSYQQPPDDETKEETILEETKDEEPIEDEFFEVEEPEPTILQPPPPEPTILQPPPPEPTILQQPPPPILEPDNQIVLRKPQKVGQIITSILTGICKSIADQHA